MIALAVAIGTGVLAASFYSRTSVTAPLNPSGDIAPNTKALYSKAFLVAAFGDSKGRAAVFDHAVDSLDPGEAYGQPVLAILGDFVEQNSEFEFRYATDLVMRARERNVIVFVTIGNHEGFDRHDNLSRERYERFFGPTVSWFRLQGVLFVSCDTADEKSFPEEQAKRVEAILAAERPRSRDAILLTHVPPHVKAVLKDKRGYAKELPAEDSARMLDLAQRYQVCVLLAGHWHGSARQKFGTTDVIVQGTGGAPTDDANLFDPNGNNGYWSAWFDPGKPYSSKRTVGEGVRDGPGLERARYHLLKNAFPIAGGALAVAVASLAAATWISRKRAAP
jgi:Icc-related predicted phosphoesterase